jgi:hypothetical protein
MERSIMVRRKIATLNPSGFSLIQALVAVGISAGIILTVASFVHQAAIAQKSLQTSQAFNDMISVVQMSIDSFDACTYNFGAPSPGFNAVTLPPVGGEVEVALLQYDPANPLRPRTQAQPLTKKPDGTDLDLGLSVTGTKLRTISQLRPGHWVARVTVTARKIGSAIGSPEVTQSFPLYIFTDGFNKVTNCFGNYAAAGKATHQQTQCEVLLGPEYFFNPQTHVCEERYEKKCFAGTKTTATCPDYTLGLNSSEPCAATGYSDPLKNTKPKFSRRYPGGVEKFASWPSAFTCIKVNNRTVTCGYASDVSTVGAQCQACCNVERAEAKSAAIN